MIIPEVQLKILTGILTGATAVDARNVGFPSRRALTSYRKQVNVKIPVNRYSFF